MSIPAHIKAGKSAVIRGTISATNTQIECVWDSAYLTFDEEGVIRYVKNSAVIHNGGTANGQVLDANALLSDRGVKLADRNDVWGVIPGGADYAGYVTFELFVDRA